MKHQMQHQGGAVGDLDSAVLPQPDPCAVGDLDSAVLPQPDPLDTQSCLPTTVALQCMQDTHHQEVPFGNSPIHFLDAGRQLSSDSCGNCALMSCDEHSMLSQLPSPEASDRAMLATHYSPSCWLFLLIA